jgi:hypothetical protein
MRIQFSTWTPTSIHHVPLLLLLLLLLAVVTTHHSVIVVEIHSILKLLCQSIDWRPVDFPVLF